MRAATSARDMPARRIAHAVSATPPAPAVASSRVAACPASVICVLARMPMREPASTLTARKSTMWPRKESASSPSAAASQRGSPSLMRSHRSGRSATAGASSTSDPSSSALTASGTSNRRSERAPADGPSCMPAGISAGAVATAAMAVAFRLCPGRSLGQARTRWCG